MSALDGLVQSINDRMRQMIEYQHQSHQEALQRHAQAHQDLIQKLSQPKQVIRDANGKITGVM